MKVFENVKVGDEVVFWVKETVRGWLVSYYDKEFYVYDVVTKVDENYFYCGKTKILKSGKVCGEDHAYIAYNHPNLEAVKWSDVENYSVMIEAIREVYNLGIYSILKQESIEKAYKSALVILGEINHLNDNCK